MLFWENGFTSIDKNLKLITGIYIVGVVLLITFFLRDGDDISFHLQRLDAIIQEISHYGLQAFPIKIYHSTLNGYGYASPLFYGDIFMWPAAIVASCLNLSVVTAYKIMLVYTFVVMVSVSYYSFKKIYAGHQLLVAWSLYVVSLTVFSNAIGSCVGRNFATIFVPLSIASFYCIVFGKGSISSNVVLLSVSVTGLLLSNVLDAIIVVVSLLVLFLFCICYIRLNKFLAFMGSAVLCFFLSAWFIIPMLEQMNSQIFFVTSNEIVQGTNDLSKWTVPWIGYFLPANVVSLMKSKLGIFGDQYMPWAYMYGIVYFIFVISITILKKQTIKTDEKWFYRGLIFVLMVYVLFNTAVFPHKIFAQVINVFQFPWRVNIVMTCFVAMLIGKLFAEDKESHLRGLVLAVGMYYIVSSAFCTYSINAISAYNHGRPLAIYSYDTYSIGCAEYLPLEFGYGENDGFDRGRWRNKIRLRGVRGKLLSDALLKDYVIGFDRLEIKGVDKVGKQKEIITPFVYYKGYIAVNEKNQNLDVYKNKDGYVVVKINYPSERILVKYEGTKLQRYSLYVSCITLVLLIGWIVIHLRESRLNYV